MSSVDNCGCYEGGICHPCYNQKCDEVKDLQKENEDLKEKLLAITYNADEHGQALSHLEALQKNYDSLERCIDICIDDFNKADKGRIKSEAEVKALQKERAATIAHQQKVINTLVMHLRHIIEDIESPDHEAHDWSQQVVVRNAKEALKEAQSDE